LNLQSSDYKAGVLTEHPPTWTFPVNLLRSLVKSVKHTGLVRFGRWIYLFVINATITRNHSPARYVLFTLIRQPSLFFPYSVVLYSKAGFATVLNMSKQVATTCFDLKVSCVEVKASI